MKLNNVDKESNTVNITLDFVELARILVVLTQYREMKSDLGAQITEMQREVTKIVSKTYE